MPRSEPLRCLGVLGLLACLSVADGRAGEELFPDKSWTPEPGDTGIVYPEAGKTTFASKDLISYLAFMKAVKAGDDVGVSELRVRGQLVAVPAHTRFLVIMRHTGAIVTGGVNAVEVRFLEGEHKDKSAWIPEFEVTRMVPRRQPTEFELELRKKELERREAERRKAIEDERAAKEQVRANEAIMERVHKEMQADESRKRSLRAATALRSAQNLEKAKKIPGAMGLYRQLIKDYPGTPQAKEAAERIKGLGGK
jgi:hypothetical protein